MGVRVCVSVSVRMGVSITVSGPGNVFEHRAVHLAKLQVPGGGNADPFQGPAFFSGDFRDDQSHSRIHFLHGRAQVLGGRFDCAVIFSGGARDTELLLQQPQLVIVVCVSARVGRGGIAVLWLGEGEEAAADEGEEVAEDQDDPSFDRK